MSESKKRKDYYPKLPKFVGPEPMPKEKLNILLENELREWNLLKSSLPENPFKERVELYREFKFESFLSAIEFMNKLAPGCDILNHHPRWENIWKTVIVYTTTWDIEHEISDRDLQLARYFDKEFEKFSGAIDKKKKTEKVKLPSKGFIFQLKELIAANKIIDVLDKLKEYFLLNSKNDKLNDVVQFLARINMIKEKELNGAVSTADANLAYNQIRKQLLEFIDQELEK